MAVLAKLDKGLWGKQSLVKTASMGKYYLCTCQSSPQI